MKHGITVGPDGAYAAVLIEGLDDMQEAVGGYIEPVRSVVMGDVQCYVDEDGGMKRLTPNTWASMFCGRFIVGDILILGPTVANDDTSLTPEQSADIIASVEGWY